MTWFKVDDSFHSHPKVLATDPAALGLWVIAGSWCGANLTDGFVPHYVLARLVPNAGKLAVKLVQVGLWETAEDGYRFRDWLHYNPTAESEKKRKAGNARRQADWRQRSNETRNSDSNALRDDQHEPQRNGVTNAAPSRPVPIGTSVRGESPEPARATRPPERCPKHRNDLDAPPCGACRDARHAAQTWDQDAPRRALAERVTIRACLYCDGDGYRLTPGTRIPLSPFQRCDHTRPDGVGTASQDLTAGAR